MKVDQTKFYCDGCGDGPREDGGRSFSIIWVDAIEQTWGDVTREATYWCKEHIPEEFDTPPLLGEWLATMTAYYDIDQKRVVGVKVQTTEKGSHRGEIRRIRRGELIDEMEGFVNRIDDAMAERDIRHPEDKLVLDP